MTPEAGPLDENIPFSCIVYFFTVAMIVEVRVEFLQNVYTTNLSYILNLSYQLHIYYIPENVLAVLRLMWNLSKVDNYFWMHINS